MYEYEVVGVGNAIVDMLVEVDDVVLDRRNFEKGKMALIDEEVSQNLHQQFKNNSKCSGGSAANTIAGLSFLGSKTAYIGKVKNDSLGRFFAQHIRSGGIKFDTPMNDSGEGTANCIVLVTPDAERTMLTFLGAACKLTPDDIDEGKILSSRLTYLEGYLWDTPLAKEALVKAATIAKNGGRIVSFSLSDPFCVERHRTEFKNLVRNYTDVLFANEEEILGLYEVDDIEEAVFLVKNDCKTAVLTRGELGSIIISEGQPVPVEAVSVPSVVDTTGAGDAFAAGFLFGITSNLEEALAGRLGALCAAEVISKTGARPSFPMPERIKNFITDNINN